MDKRSLLFVFAVTAAFFAIHAWFDPPKKQEEQLVQLPPPKPFIADLNAPPSSGENYYVIETPYQQLVFSSRGGSLSEINLPFNTTSPKSIVREIDIDRQILTQSPENSYFPLYPALKAGEHSPGERALGGYYPLLRRTLVGPNGEIAHLAPAESYALNITGNGGINPANAIWKMTKLEPQLIQFQYKDSIRSITKTYSIPEERVGPYCLNLEIAIDGDATGLFLTSGVPDVELVGGSYSPVLRNQITKPSGNEVDDLSLPKKGPITSQTKVNWISNCNGFLGLIIDGILQKTDGYKAISFDGSLLPTRLSLIDATHALYPAANYPGYSLMAALPSNTTMTYRIFAGPYDEALLKELDNLYRNPIKGYNPEYAEAQSIQGWFSFISQPFSKFLFFLMQIFYTITSSWAAAIILLTIALRAMMYPLNAWSIRSSVKMQEIAPKIRALQERHKKDPKRAQLEVMNLYREAKVNPFTGCLPMLLQMPFLFGMFYLLKSSFPLRGAPFIPGWIDDLAAPDVLFSWGQPIWLIGNEFHLLPILMGVTMYLQQSLTSKLPKDSKNLSDAQKQQKMMGNMMSILFTVMFYGMPSGLNLYFMCSTLLAILQQWWMGAIKKQNGSLGAVPF